MIMKVFTTHLDQNLMRKIIKMINNIKKEKQQNNNIDTKPPNVFNYLKSLSQEAKDLMDDKEDANDDIDDGKFFLLEITEKKLTLTFLGSH